MRVLVLLPCVVSAVTLGGVKQVAQMRETFRAIAQQMKANGEADDGTKIIIGEMLTQINDTLVPALKRDSENAQIQLNNSLKAVNDCLDRRTEKENGVITRMHGETGSSRDAHTECRGEKVEVLVQKKKKNKHHHRAPNQTQEYGYDHTGRHWSDYDANASHSHDYDGPDHPSVVAETLHEADAFCIMEEKCDHLDGKVAAFDLEEQEKACMDTDAVFDWFTTMCAWTETHAESYKNSREECHEARHNHQHRVAECNKLQEEFEADYCTECKEIDHTCYNYDQCYALSHESWVNTTKIVEDLEGTFLAQQEALECLLCYGEQIMANKTDLSVCEDATCKGCDCLNIIYVDPHAQKDCPPCEHRPCDDGFCDAEYASFATSYTPVQDCTPCAPVTFR